MRMVLKKFLILGLMLVIISTSFIFIGAIIDTQETQVAYADLQSIEDIAALDRYDSRDYGYVTPVRDQGDSNLCWAYASISASEVSILKSGIDNGATKDNLSLSPNALAYARHNRGKDPLGNTNGEVTGQNWYTTSGDPSYSATVLSQWCGPSDSALPATANQFENARYHLQNAVYIQDNDISAIKKAIAKYGAVTFSYNNLRETTYYNPKNETSTNSYPHACTLIGWDDNILSSNFVPSGASQNGGWIVKNSYNSLPYFYLSYDNKCSTAYAFDYTNIDTYDYNYFYDYSLTDGLNSTLNNRLEKVGNVFEAKNGGSGFDEYIQAVNVGFWGKDVTCNVQVYTDVEDKSEPQSGTLATTASATFDYGGYRTVELNKPVKISKGSQFAIVVSVSNPSGNAQIRFMQGGGKDSYIFKDYWTKYPNNTARVKAFTSLQESEQNQVDINLATFNIEGDSFVYSGEEICPNVTAKYDGKVLQEGIDYSLTYFNNKLAGTATIIAQGMGDFVGNKSLTFVINKAPLPSVMPWLEMQVSNDIMYLSQVQLPSGWSWQNSNIALVEGANTKLIAVYADTANYELYSVEVTVFRQAGEQPPQPTEPIQPIEPPKYDISNAEFVLFNYTYTYTGQEICPQVTVKFGGIVLTQNIDYSLIYLNNINVGAATIVAQGMGDYVGNKSLTFVISKAPLPTVIPPLEMQVTNNITNLSQVQLPSGWSWQNSNSVLIEGTNNKFVAVYEDSANYETHTVEITIYRQFEENKTPIEDSDAQDKISSLWWLLAIPITLAIVAFVIVVIYMPLRRDKSNK